MRRQLVELRAEQDGTVMAVGKVSVGSVLTAGQQFITLVPTDAPLEVEANIPGNEDGYVHVGDPVDIKFDTFPYTQYGMAHGVVRIVSPDSFTRAGRAAQSDRCGARCATRATGVWYRVAGSRWIRSTCTTRRPNFHLIPGMPIKADILVGKQTVLRYMLGQDHPAGHRRHAGAVEGRHAAART